MVRLADWRPRLFEYVERVRRLPLEFGANDCGQFAGGWIEALTGENPAAELRGLYASQATGIALVRARMGYTGPVDWARALFPIVPIAMAQVGDLAVLKTPQGPALGGVQGERIYAVGVTGLTTVDLLTARSAFRV